MRVTTWTAALLVGMALALPVGAQEDAIPKETPPPASDEKPAPEEPAPTETAPAPTAPAANPYGIPPLHRWGGWTIAVSAWEPSLVGADEELATTFLGGIGYPVMAGSTARIRETIAVVYHLPKNVGSIGGSYEGMDQDDTFQYLTPGQFIWGETRAFPITPGVFDDGFADGVEATILRKTRDFRLWYSQTAFETAKARGTWSVGYRQLSHSRQLQIAYLSLVPNLPPLIPPVPTNIDPLALQPFPDLVNQSSEYNGHGLGVSFDLQFPVAPRLCVVTGLSIGLIRGSMSSAYSSRTSYYYLTTNPDVPLTRDELFAIMSSGASDSQIANLAQAVVFAGDVQSDTSQMAQTYDIYLGLEVNAYKGLKVFGMLRDVFYANVGEYVVPRIGFYNDRTTLSAGYEGYVLGLSWRY